MVVPPDTPTCYVKGIIRNVEFEDEYLDPCLKDESIPCPPGVMPGTTRPAQYRLTVLIQEASFVGGSTRVESCEDRYPAGSEEVLYIYKVDVVDEPFEKDHLIEGRVWNSYFQSYNVTGG